MRALRAPLLGNGDRSSGRGGQRLQMFLRQFGSDLVSPPRPRRRTTSGNVSNNSNAHASIAPGDVDWASPRSSKGRGGGRGGRGGGLRVDTQLSDEDDDYLDAVGNGVRRQRELTAEFGSGSEANPALFASSASARRAVSAPAPADGGTAAEESRTSTSTQRSRRGGGAGGVRGDDNDMGRISSALDHSGRRKWVEENPSSDGESAIEEFARTRIGIDVQGHVHGESKEHNMSIFSSPSSRQGHSNPSFLGEESVGLASEDGSRINASVGGGGGERPNGDAHDRDDGRGNDFRHAAPRSRGGHGTVGTEVVEGYVSLESHHHQQQQHRRGSEDDGDGGLVVAGRPRGKRGGGGGGRGAGAGAGQALSMFREQLYEEGRGKGGKGGNLASR